MSKYAIIECGSKQFRVEPQTTLEVELLHLPQDQQKEVTLESVLLIQQDGETKVGNPFVAGARVVCDYLGEGRAPKVISLKYRRRKASRRKRGHRQSFSRLRVKDIIL